ncbi:MAG: hypothetical protein II943_09820 [Victivallales bacterium]|nr:hypothetical protein [Victivallales bacterium]
MDSPFEIPQDFPVPPEPPAGLRVYQDERGEVLSHSRRNLASTAILTVWLVCWWVGIIGQFCVIYSHPTTVLHWFIFSLFCIPGLLVPFVLLGTLYGAQELCFRFDGEVTICRRYGVFQFSSKKFHPKDIQHLAVSQAPAYTKNGNRINHLTNTSTLDIELPDETLHVMFPNDPDQAIARYCGTRLRAIQKTF